MRSRRLSTWLLALIVLASSSALHSQTASAPATEHRATSTPYSGDLSIFETPGRDEKLHIDQVMTVLGIQPGKNVADIGAGSGWFTVRAAKRVTSSGEVYAVDINPQAVEYIDKRVSKEQLHNVKAIRSTPDNPELPAGSVDAVLFLKVYHEVSDPVALMRNLRVSLKPGARVGIIERNGNGEDHGVDKQVVLREVKQAGYRLVSEHDDLVKGDKMDYFLVLAAN